MIKEILLPQPKLKGKISVEEAIFSRRSIRNFTTQELTIEQLSQILWVSQGQTKDGYRSAPSAGALYPIEIRLIKKDGLFKYLTSGHKIVLLSAEDFRKPLAQGALYQNSIIQAPVTIIISANYNKITPKYGQRGISYSYIETGHIAQNIHLEAVALGLGSVPIGAFDDKTVKEILLLPTENEPLYIVPIGYAR